MSEKKNIVVICKDDLSRGLLERLIPKDIFSVRLGPDTEVIFSELGYREVDLLVITPGSCHDETIRRLEYNSRIGKVLRPSVDVLISGIHSCPLLGRYLQGQVEA